MNTRDFLNNSKRWLRPFVNQPLGVFLLVASASGFIAAYHFGSASLNYYTVSNAKDKLEQPAFEGNVADFKAAKLSIDEAIISHPTHPHYYDEKGELLEWQAVTSTETQTGLLLAAKAQHLSAMTLRPTWPVTYASLAMIKWRLAEFDDEMESFLQAADRFGPMKAEVHTLFAELGLSLYEANHPFYLKLKPFMNNRLSLGLRNPASRARVLETIRTLDQVKTVCRWMDTYDPQIAQQILRCA